MHNWVVIAVGEHIAAQEALSSRGILIRIDKSANFRVIVSALQVVEAGLRIVIIPTVAEGVVVGHMRGCRGDCRPRRVGYAQHLPVGVVGVLRHQGPRVAPAACVAAVKSRYVPLQVFGEIVVRPACLRRVLQPKPYRATTLVVQVPQSQAHAPLVLYNGPVGAYFLRSHTPHGFLHHDRPLISLNNFYFTSFPFTRQLTP